MFSKLINWLFSKTRIGKLLDGKKTELGFLLWVLAQAILILAEATSVFPGVPALAAIHQSLVLLQSAIGDGLAQVGLGVMVVGVGHKAIKENQ